MSTDKNKLKSVTKKLLKILLAVFIWTILTEIFLRYSYEIFPQSLGSEMATGYHTGFTGIYKYDSEMYMNKMKPDFERKMYFNGYHWFHKTDKNGFRNPVDRDSADVVLLGDSMIYGHGIDESNTIRNQLEKISRLSVYNLSIQGACSHQEYQIMKKFAVRLKPKFAFLFFLTNDIHDLTVYFNADQMHQFIAQQTDILNIRYFKISHRPNWMRFIDFWQDLYVVRAINALPNILIHKFGWDNDGSQNNKLAMNFHLDAIKKIHRIAMENNIIFTNIFVYTGHPYYAKQEPFYEKTIQDYCHSHNILFLSLHESFNNKMKEGEKLFLDHDGHFSPRGAQIVAEVLSLYIKKHEADKTLNLYQ